jgi:hypothetical protein
MPRGDALKSFQVFGYVPEQVVVFAYGVVFGYGYYD